MRLLRGTSILWLIGALCGSRLLAGTADTADLENRLETAVRNDALQKLNLELRSEDPLRAVAREHSLVLSTGVDIDSHEFLRQSLSAHGILDPFPYVFYGSAAGSELAELQSRGDVLTEKMDSGFYVFWRNG